MPIAAAGSLHDPGYVKSFELALPPFPISNVRAILFQTVFVLLILNHKHSHLFI